MIEIINSRDISTIAGGGFCLENTNKLSPGEGCITNTPPAFTSWHINVSQGQILAYCTTGDDSCPNTVPSCLSAKTEPAYCGGSYPPLMIISCWPPHPCTVNLKAVPQ